MTNSIKIEEPVRGSLDSSFGIEGKVHLYVEDEIQIQPRAVCVLSDGRILCTASSDKFESIYLVMLDNRGVVDESFGEAGTSRFKLSDFSEPRSAQPYSIKFDADNNKIVVGFFISEGGYGRRTGLARFDLNGPLDTSFGDRGVMMWSPVPDNARRTFFENASGLSRADSKYQGSMVLTSNGGAMILTTLRYDNRWDGTDLVKVKRDGTLDEAFGDEGSVIVKRSDKAVRAEDLVRQGESFLVAGTTSIAGEGEWFVARFDKAGKLDKTFAVSGYYDGNPGVQNAVLYREDKSTFHIVGTSANTDSQHLFVTLQRRGSNGEEDAHFGSQGWSDVLSDDASVRDTVIFKSALYNSGSTVVVAGHNTVFGETAGRTIIASIEQDMGWDSAFGVEGRFKMAGDTVVHDLAIQSDRKIVFVSSSNRSPDSFAIVRLHG